jgi:hypothetical protein
MISGAFEDTGLAAADPAGRYTSEFPMLGKLHQEITEAVNEAAQDLKELKERKSEIEAAIIQRLNFSRIGAVKVDGIGTFTRISKTHVNFQNAEVICRTMFSRMADLDAKGLPLINGLLLTKTPNQKAVLDEARESLKNSRLPENSDTLNNILNPMGFGIYVTDTLHFASVRAK